MPGISINLDGDGAWPDLKEKAFTHVKDEHMQLAVLTGGMRSGLPSVAIRLELPSGEIVVAETSARIFCAAAKAIMARHPGLFDD